MTFEVIEGGARKRVYHGRQTEQIVCRRCEEVTGVATSLFQEALQSPMRSRGRRVGGTRVLVCVHCLSRGEVVLC